MPTSPWKEGDTERALQFWAEYQKLHDVSDRHGQTVGIDPLSGRVWFGKSAIEVVKNAQADGFEPPFYLLRVGYDYYRRKGRGGLRMRRTPFADCPFVVHLPAHAKH